MEQVVAQAAKLDTPRGTGCLFGAGAAVSQSCGEKQEKTEHYFRVCLYLNPCGGISHGFYFDLLHLHLLLLNLLLITSLGCFLKDKI